MKNPLETAYKHYALGEMAAARKTIEAHLKDKPDDYPAVFLKGVLDLEAGAVEEGAKNLDLAGKAVTPPPQLAHRAGRILFDAKNFKAAAHWLNVAIKKKPDQAQSHYWLGNALRMLGDAKGAEAALKQAIRFAPKEARAYVSLAYLYREAGHLKAAAEVMTELSSKAAKGVQDQEKIAGFLVEISRLDLAEKVLTRLLPEKGEEAPFLLRLGQIRQKLGMFREAAQCYRRAIIRDPSADAAYTGLAVVKKFESPSDPDAVILQQALVNEGVSKSGVVCAHFALGKVYDDCRDYATAFDHYDKANALRHQDTPFDRAAFRDRISALKRIFQGDIFKKLGAPPQKDFTPVFVVGMLRSGTTLAETMLATHKQVFGAGELNHIPDLAKGLSGAANSAAFPDYVPFLKPETIAEAAREYARAVRALSLGEPLVIDKNPLNFLNLGLIALMFPNAKVIHCRRNPLDTALSIYFQNFAHEENAYAYNLSDIAAYTLGYRELMEHWYEELPLEIFDLDYENLVKFPERVTQRAMGYLGVDWDESILDFHSADRTVQTASLWQVRQPLYRDSIERWKHYEKHLEKIANKFRSKGIL